MNKTRITINIIVNSIAYAFSIIISFYLTPFIVNTLGEEAYGFTSLTNNIISYFTIITVAINSMADRFISIAFHKGEIEKAQKYFSTVLVADIILAVILMLLGVITTIFLDSLIVIPPELVFDVKAMFLLFFLSSMIVLSLSAYKSSTFVKNRIDINAYIGIIKPVLRGGFLLLVFSLFAPSIIYLGFAMLLIMSFEALSFIFVKKKVMPEIVAETSDFDWDKLKELVKSGSWNILSKLNVILAIGLDLLIANLFIGPEAMGILALAKIVPSYSDSFLAIIGTSFTPSLTKEYSNNENSLLINLKKSFVPLTIFGSVMIGGILSVAQDFYRLWLPNLDAKEIFVLTTLTMLSSMISYGTIASGSIFTIKNKLKKITMLQTFTSLLAIILVFILLKFTKLGIYAVAGTSAIIGTIKNLVFVYPYISTTLKQKWYALYPYVMRSVLCLVIVYTIGLIVKNFINIDSWPTFALSTVIISSVSLIINSFIVTKKSQRELIYTKIKAMLYYKK